MSINSLLQTCVSVQEKRKKKEKRRGAGGGGAAQNQQRPVRKKKKRERKKRGKKPALQAELGERDSRSVEGWETKVSASFIP